ncbi:hypothetical protein AB6A40_004667 [Gnathostoma spinigerum]|uniref:Transmembrane and coiled-coil domains protein 1 n=1 Tax=Gnathostoma spinigerum TaxID=75299 RepID=A0ABD6EDB7_9BILA
MSKFFLPHEQLCSGSEGSNERKESSFRSSEGGSFEVGFDSVSADEKFRIEQKIEQIKERLSRISLAREADVEDFLRMTKSLENGQDNPQMARVRQHFDKKNKKNTQETERLTIRLEQLLAKLRELENGGGITESSSRSTVLHNIRKTGPLLREVTGSVISAPIEFAQRIRNTLGSTENVSEKTGDISNVGQSTFYSHSVGEEKNHGACSSTREVSQVEHQEISSHLTRRNETVPTNFITMPDFPEEPKPRTDMSENSALREELMEEIRKLKRILGEQIGKVQANAKTDVMYLNEALHEERIKTQRLEEMLNETMELNQAERISLKTDLNTISTKIDYQYRDQFRSIEEKIERVQDRMLRVETNVKEWTEARPESIGSRIMLSAANFLVELLKIILFIISFVLDFVKPFTGTRTRAGFAILITSVIMIISHYIDIGFIWSSLIGLDGTNGTSTATISVASIPSPPSDADPLHPS